MGVWAHVAVTKKIRGPAILEMPVAGLSKPNTSSSRGPTAAPLGLGPMEVREPCSGNVTAAFFSAVRAEGLPSPPGAWARQPGTVPRQGDTGHGEEEGPAPEAPL